MNNHFDGTRFYNPWERRRQSFKDLLLWKLKGTPQPWPSSIPYLVDTPPLRVEESSLRVTFIGQSSLLLQTAGLNILTDPIWSSWASPIKTSRTHRINPPGISFDALPPIDLILLSHNHYDHLDRRTLLRLGKRDTPLLIAPLGNGKFIPSSLHSLLLDWGESKEVKGLTVHLLPSQHWSARGFFDHDRALWGAFVLSTPSGNLYFNGDTGYGGDIFKKAKEEFGSFRFAALPIGSYEPRWFMRYAHMNPEEAVLAHLDLGGPYTLGIHHSTFRLTDEAYDAPFKALEKAKEQHHIPDDHFRALTIGSSWYIP